MKKSKARGNAEKAVSPMGKKEGPQLALGFEQRRGQDGGSEDWEANEREKMC